MQFLLLVCVSALIFEYADHYFICS